MFKKILIYIISTLTILLFVLSIVVLIAGSILQKEQKLINVFGYSYSVVATESMEPTIMVGDIIIAKQVAFEEVQVEDIIVFYSTEYQKYFVHRVIDKDENNDYITKGDNPRAPIDEEPVTRDNFYGVVIKYGSFLSLGQLILKYRSLIFGVMMVIFLIIIISETITIIKNINEKNRIKLENQLEQEKLKLLEEEEQRIRAEMESKRKNKN
ncbi:MAG TPA: signal peptidase I [Bacilli bacterium]|nr:MAG: Signal peptidase I W [Tenericutes bacterium ADurb.BinA124]HNZ50579.1 signal peptidase I [Bacilli bacterium]HOH17934.1 signal peptidase I [Bacilli bacterium]HPN60610.1 signal peptidase I [Bacilli bacterium]HPX83875.1 signal peptidase I [Bacilli bacterium]